MTYKRALEKLSREDRFRATVYAMNSLLILKGAYSRVEFQHLFAEWATKELRKKTKIPSDARRCYQYEDVISKIKNRHGRINNGRTL